MTPRAPDNSEMLNIEGLPAESIFYRAIKWCLVEDSALKLQHKIDETMGRIAALNDDRLLVLVGALLVENAVDEFLSAIIPDYDQRAAKFSVGIKLARALRLCPSRIFAGADVIREIRNEFVHDLSCDAFDKLPNGKSQSMLYHLSKYNPKDVSGKSDAEVFKMLVTYVKMALWIYTRHVLWLNKFIRSKEFYPALKSFCEAQGGGAFT